VSKLSEYFKKPSGAFMCGCLVAALGTGAIDTVKNDLVGYLNPSIETPHIRSGEVVLPRDNSDEINEYRVVKSEFVKIKSASEALLYENSRLLKSIESLVDLYSELEQVHLDVNNRVTPQEEVKLLASVAMDWLSVNKEAMNAGRANAEHRDVVSSIPASYLGKMHVEKGDITPAHNFDWMRRDPVYTFLDNKVDYKTEALKMRGEIENMKDTVEVFKKDNLDLKTSLLTMLNQLDVIYNASNATDFKFEVVARAVDNYAAVVNKFVKENRPNNDKQVAIADDVGDLIRELDEVVPSNEVSPQKF
jgi:hypothetical protein